MPRLTNSVPKYRKHRASGQAIVTLNGRDHYLGPHGTKASHVEYDRLVSEWLVAGRQTTHDQAADLRVVGLCAAYLRHAKEYYVKNGKPTSSVIRVKRAIEVLKESHGRVLVREFGPLAIQAIQSKLATPDHARSYANDLIGVIKQIFRWGASREMVPVSVAQSLATVPMLRKDRSTAREPEPIQPVDAETVKQTLECLPSIVADIVRVQALTGCRPAEARLIRPCEIDRSEDIWKYRPGSHKTEHHGKDRLIFIGPKAQEVLRPYLLRAAESYCFSPAESERNRKATMRARRKTPVQPSQQDRSRKTAKRKPSEFYSKDAYTRAVSRAAKKAKVQHWHPNQLRHSAGTEIRKRFGLEAAQVTLGHASADVTQVYAERDMSLAERVAREVG